MGRRGGGPGGLVFCAVLLGAKASAADHPVNAAGIARAQKGVGTNDGWNGQYWASHEQGTGDGEIPAEAFVPDPDFDAGSPTNPPPPPDPSESALACSVLQVLRCTFPVPNTTLAAGVWVRSGDLAGCAGGWIDEEMLSVAPDENWIPP
ncbi:hypothetical protein EDC04DRAFT_59290 [Pisolithus marmoratus]|nr:hypothetical protein EDC04DRAFT_59290 [Pisolithus marmoratus]